MNKKIKLYFMTIFLCTGFAVFSFCSLVVLANDNGKLDYKNVKSYEIILYGNEDEHDIVLLKERLQDLIGAPNYFIQKTDGGYQLFVADNDSIAEGIYNYLEWGITNTNALEFCEEKEYPTPDFQTTTYIMPSVYELSQKDILSVNKEEKEEDGWIDLEEHRNIDEINERESSINRIIKLSDQAMKACTDYMKEHAGEAPLLYYVDQKLKIEFQINDPDKKEIFVTGENNEQYQFLYRMLEYSLLHEPLHHCFQYEVLTEDSEIEYTAGNDFESDEDVYTIRYITSSLEDENNFSENRKKEFDVIDKRLRAMGQEYFLQAYGDGDIILKIKGPINEELMRKISAYDFSFRSDYFEWMFEIQTYTDDVLLSSDYSNKRIILNLLGKDDESRFGNNIKKIFEAEEMPVKRKADSQDDSEKIYLMIEDDPIAYTELKKDDSFKKLEFDNFCFSDEGGSNYEESNFYAKLLQEVINGEKLPYRLDLQSFSYNGIYNDPATLTLPTNYITEMKGLKEQVLQKYTRATFTEKRDSDTLAIYLHLDPNTMDSKNVLENIAEYYQSIDERYFKSIAFYPCDEIGSEKLAIAFMSASYLGDEDIGTSTEEGMNILFKCFNGRFDSIADQFYEEVHKNAFFKDAADKLSDRAYYVEMRK